MTLVWSKLTTPISRHMGKIRISRTIRQPDTAQSYVISSTSNEIVSSTWLHHCVRSREPRTLGSIRQLGTPYLQGLKIPYEMRSRKFDNGTFDIVLGKLLRRIRRKKGLELDKCSQREIRFLIDLIGKTYKHGDNCVTVPLLRRIKCLIGSKDSI